MEKHQMINIVYNDKTTMNMINKSNLFFSVERLGLFRKSVSPQRNSENKEKQHFREPKKANIYCYTTG